MALMQTILKHYSININTDISFIIYSVILQHVSALRYKSYMFLYTQETVPHTAEKRRRVLLFDSISHKYTQVTPIQYPQVMIDNNGRSKAHNIFFG